jgi:hypothetical protein
LTGNKEFKKKRDIGRSLKKNGNLVQIFASEDKLNSLRAKNRKEFGLNYILKVLETNTKDRGNQKNEAKFIIP